MNWPPVSCVSEMNRAEQKNNGQVAVINYQMFRSLIHSGIDRNSWWFTFATQVTFLWSTLHTIQFSYFTWSWERLNAVSQWPLLGDADSRGARITKQHRKMCRCIIGVKGLGLTSERTGPIRPIFILIDCTSRRLKNPPYPESWIIFQIFAAPFMLHSI